MPEHSPSLHDRLPATCPSLRAARILGAAFACALLLAATSHDRDEYVRPAAVAGAFYPDDPKVLRHAVEQFLEKASPQVPENLKTLRPRALIVPHAGYEYSGQTAAYAYKLLQGKPKPARIVVIGPSHRVYVKGVGVLGPYTHYETPLGRIKMDADACNQLLKSERFVSRAVAHDKEHDLEVQLPFVQVLWPEPPPIVPIIVGELPGNDLKGFAKALAAVLDDDTLIIASSDFTHYGARFDFAPFGETPGKELGEKIQKLDMGAVEFVDKLDGPGFLDYCDRTGATICGRVPIAVLLEVLAGMKGVAGARLHYASSADVVGDGADRVSYYAHAFYVVPPVKNP